VTAGNRLVPKVVFGCVAAQVTNVWNRINVSTKQVAGEWAKSADAQKWEQRRSAAR